MGRYKKLILLVSALALAAGSLTLFRGEKNSITISVERNEVIIDNFEMAKVVDEKNNFYKIKAESAVLDREGRKAELTDFILVYKKGDTDLRASSHKGVIQEETRIDVSGKISGSVNDLNFETGPDGLFYFDFDTEVGVLSGNVVVESAEITILADTVTVYHNRNILEFNGNVKAVLKN